ncbi:hypothetical protein ABBQ32_013062 [Trebouxia sp. C0010 RCD-2024]
MYRDKQIKTILTAGNDKSAQLDLPRKGRDNFKPNLSVCMENYLLFLGLIHPTYKYHMFSSLHAAGAEYVNPAVPLQHMNSRQWHTFKCGWQKADMGHKQ